MPDQGTPSELLVLQAVRLAGVADTDAILDRTFLPGTAVAGALTAATASGALEPFTFGGTSGWILTEAGSARLATLLSREVTTSDATGVLEVTLDAFEPLNEHFVGLVSRWQLQSTSSTATGYGASGALDALDALEVDGLLGALTSLGGQLRECLAELIRRLPRFGRYPAQYATAVDRARQEGLRWVTGVGLLSCHVVWAELHQDLLSSLGRDRFAEQRNW